MSYEQSASPGGASFAAAAPRCAAAEPSVLYQCCLWSSGGLSIYANRWHRDRNPVRFEDVNYQPILALPKTGSYLRVIRGKTQVVDANTASFCDADVPFAIDHRETVETDVTVIGMERGLLDAARGASPRPSHAAPAGAGALSLPLCPRGALLHRLMVRELAASPRADDLAIFECVSALLSCVLDGQQEPAGAARPRVSAAAVERVTAVRLLLSRAYGEPLSLECIARVAGCSLWNLSREFTALVGRPIHKYLVRLRLRHVLQEVLDGAGDLTAVALRAGFSSHSHMTAAFRREFCRAPSSLRGVGATSVLRQLVRELRRPAGDPSCN